jgi:hypothetical protein
LAVIHGEEVGIFDEKGCHKLVALAFSEFV